MTEPKPPVRKPVILAPGAGRAYPMGRINALFKADGEETESRYSISEWWLEPRTQGPGPHEHDEDDIFYVLEGTMSFKVGEGAWMDAAKGSFIQVPGGTLHDFENRGSERSGVLIFKLEVFEEDMPGIVWWFTENPPKDTETT